MSVHHLLSPATKLNERISCSLKDEEEEWPLLILLFYLVSVHHLCSPANKVG